MLLCSLGDVIDVSQNTAAARFTTCHASGGVYGRHLHIVAVLRLF